MLEIRENQELKYDNVLSFRGKLKQTELEQICRDMESKASGAGARKVANPITAIFGVENDLLDTELLIPLDKPVPCMDRYVFKDKFKIVNAVEAQYKGHPAGLQGACNELNGYISNKKMQPITVGYNVTRHMDPIHIENTEVSVYVGVSPNIL